MFNVDTTLAESEDEPDDDEVLDFHKGLISPSFFTFISIPYIPLDLLFRGVLQCAQKMATQYGDCLALTSFWKNSLLDYHEAKKVFVICLVSYLYCAQ